MSNSIPSGPCYGVYISKLIRYARYRSYYDDFRHCHEMLVGGLVSQGYRYERLRNSFKKPYGGCRDLAEVAGVVRGSGDAYSIWST